MCGAQKENVGNLDTEMSLYISHPKRDVSRSSGQLAKRKQQRSVEPKKQAET